VQKTEALPPDLRAGLPPVATDCFEQVESADDIGLDEIFRAVDRTINVGFGSKVDDRARLVLRQKSPRQFAVANVAMDEDVPLVVGQRSKIFRFPA
jgi:hypothetical protein